VSYICLVKKDFVLFRIRFELADLREQPLGFLEFVSVVSVSHQIESVGYELPDLHACVKVSDCVVLYQGHKVDELVKCHVVGTRLRLKHGLHLIH